MTDPLTDRLAQALWGLDMHPPDAGRIAREQVAAIDPAQADWLRAGLLLREVEQGGWIIDRVGRFRAPYLREAMWRAIATHSGVTYSGEGPTLLAALTDLLAKLRVQP